MEYFAEEDFEINQPIEAMVEEVEIGGETHPFLFVDGFYRYPDRVERYLAATPIKCHRQLAPASRFGKDFLDGRAQHEVRRSDWPACLARIAQFFGRPAPAPQSRSFNQTLLLRPLPSGTVWWPHQDLGKLNVLIYLNRDFHSGGTSFFLPVDPVRPIEPEHERPFQSVDDWTEAFCVLGEFNRLVCFSGDLFHAMTLHQGAWLERTRFTQVQFC